MVYTETGQYLVELNRYRGKNILIFQVHSLSAFLLSFDFPNFLTYHLNYGNKIYNFQITVIHNNLEEKSGKRP